VWRLIRVFDLPGWFFLGALFLFGVVFGSFGNVVIWRLPRGESLSHPGSHCPRCDTPIAWYDNVPLLSWLVLRARCRSCGEGIPIRYPAVELVSGLLWVTAGVRFGLTATTAAAIAFFYLLQLLAFIDWDTMRLPNSLVGLLAGIGLVGSAVSQFGHIRMLPLLPLSSGWLGEPLVASAVGALAAAGPIFLLGAAYALIRKRQGYGFGDVKLLAAIGLFLGPYSLVAVFLAVLFGAVFGVASAARTGEGGRHKFPFGPFIVAGAILTTLFGPELWAWYSALAHLGL
jgi:leader peptidase (prepilin peptidase)/N-methyltransferase